LKFPLANQHQVIRLLGAPDLGAPGGGGGLIMSMVSQPERETPQAQQGQQNEQTRYYTTPLVNIRLTGEGYELSAEMPGVSKEGVEITVENGQLTLMGHRRPVQVNGRRIYRERREHDFRRVYELDPSLDASRVSARIDQGILTVTLPKAEAVKPRRITVE
jgi:HSP20 family protein